MGRKTVENPRGIHSRRPIENHNEKVEPLSRLAKKVSALEVGREDSGVDWNPIHRQSMPERLPPSTPYTTILRTANPSYQLQSASLLFAKLKQITSAFPFFLFSPDGGFPFYSGFFFVPISLPGYGPVRGADTTRKLSPK